MFLRAFLTGVVLALSGTSVASAPVSLFSGGPVVDTDLVPGQAFKGKLNAAGADTLFEGPSSLTLGPKDYKVTFSLVAAESGFSNSLLFNGSTVITESANGSLTDFTTGALAGQSFSTVVTGGTDLASLLSFEVDRGALPSLIFDSTDDEFGVFAASSALGHLTSFFLGLDDSGAQKDGDHDDIIVRVDVDPIAVIPLPAAAGLLLVAIGGLYALRRAVRPSEP